jgi:FtsP/CotA-like multicopper oxidase with cupredoxin domain
MLSGCSIAIFSSGIIHFLYSKFVGPQNIGFAILDSNIHLVKQDLSGLGAEQRDKVMVHKTRRWFTTRGYLIFITFVLIILWPVASGAARTSIGSHFAFWVLLSVIWAFGAAITITVLPLWESQDAIVRVIVGNFSFCTGNLAASEYADEKTPAKSVKEQTESDAKFFLPGSVHVHRGHRSLVEEFVPARLNMHRKTATANFKMSALSLTLLTVPFNSVITAQSIPSSPFGDSTTICPSGNTNYVVDEYPGTPFLLHLFQQNFSNPPTLKPMYKACRSDHHCMSSFEIDIVDVQKRVFDEVIPECQHHSPTWFLAYNGNLPGPSIVTASGHESLVRFNNKISDRYFNKTHSPCINGRSGNPTSVHLHGSASLAPFDGWAEDETCRNETKDYKYPNNRPNTGWYHDHALHITADNAYHGLVGFYLTSSKAKIGGCGEPWNLEGIEEKLLMLSDKVLDSECQLYADLEGAHKDNLYGDINTVNGIPFPNMPLEPKWYRFRILNAAVSRAYRWQIRDENGAANIAHTMCKVIAGDGGYRTSPANVPADGIIVNVAERYEVVCDFRSVAGKTLYMWNHNDDNYMRKIPYFCYSHLIAKIVVGENQVDAPLFEENNQSIQPSVPINKVLSEADIQTAMTMVNNGEAHRVFKFGKSNEQWTINGETWSTMKIAADDVGQDTWELWKFESGGGWHHPVHIHLIDFFILQRDGDTAVEGNPGGVKSYEQGTPKDVFGLSGGTVWTIARFGAHKGHYMFHCHNLRHEDNDMMRAYKVTQGGKNEPSAAQYLANPLVHIIYNNYEYADPMYNDTAAKPSDQVPAHSFELVNSTLYMNLYRIFYPTDDDKQQYGDYYNPWIAEWCQLPNQEGDTTNPYSQTSTPPSSNPTTLKPTSTGDTPYSQTSKPTDRTQEPTLSLPTTPKPTSNSQTSKPTDRTQKPTSSKPTTRKPTSRPNLRRPTSRPTRRPTSRPTRRPTSRPTRRPTSRPTRKPTRKPTSRPTRKPTSKPSLHHTSEDTATEGRTL